MGRIGRPRQVKLFAGLLTSLPELAPDVEERISGLFGPVDLRSEKFSFDLTHYYDREAGSPLWRFFFGFADLIEPDALAGIKIITNDLETEFASRLFPVSRPVNIDPGYMEESKVVLASTKNFYHRILLSNGIYAEVTMHYESGGWRSFPWTFPDFRGGRYDGFFAELRGIYRKQLREAAPSASQP